jgi:hypothetical protein
MLILLNLIFFFMHETPKQYPNADYQRKFKAKMQEQGYERINVWIKPEWKSAVLELIEKLKGGPD